MGRGIWGLVHGAAGAGVHAVRPCPWCAATPDATCEMVDASSAKYFVLCPACRVSGPHCSNPAVAMSAWDTYGVWDMALAAPSGEPTRGTFADGARAMREAIQTAAYDRVQAGDSPLSTFRIGEIALPAPK